MYNDIDKTIEKYQVESRNSFRQATTSKKYKNKRQEQAVEELALILEAKKDQYHLLWRIVRRHKKADILSVIQWVKNQPGKDKVRLLLRKLNEDRKN